MEVVARSRSKILLSLAPYSLYLLLVFPVYWLLIGLPLMELLRGNVRDDLVRPVTNAITVPLVLLSAARYVWFFVTRLSRCVLCLRDEEVIFRGLTRWSFVERRYRLDELESVTLGQPLNTVERFWERAEGPGLDRFLNEGRLLVTDKVGKRVFLQFLNLAFEPNEVLMFVSELRRRGVVIRL